MSVRFLFGPQRQLTQRLPRALADGVAVPYTAEQLAQAASWETFAAALNLDRMPELLVIDLAYRPVPLWLWSAPLPLVGLVGDAPLQWHWFRQLRLCERLLADAPSVQRLQRHGLTQARIANLYGVERVFLDEPTDPDQPRDIDALFVGNLNPQIQGERLPWLQRLARLRRRFRVEIVTDAWGADYRALLRRSRIVFNRSARSEWNRRVGETLAAGALALIERDNAEVPDLLGDRRACVCYDDADMEAVLEHYLTHEDERAAIAAAGNARAAEFTFEALWRPTLAELERDLPALREATRLRLLSGPWPGPAALTWQGVCGTLAFDPALLPLLDAALTQAPQDGDLHNARGIALALVAGRVTLEAARQASGCFREALVRDGQHLVASLNLAECLVALGQNELAADLARRTLTALERDRSAAPTWLDAVRFPPVLDLFQAEWHRAAWDHVGNPRGEVDAKRTLMRWRLHTLLADLTGELTHFHEAVNARPDLPDSRARLGCALGRAGKVSLAASHLRQAVERNPFDAQAARALYGALVECDDQEGARELARDQGLLSLAAPGVVPVQPWLLRPVESDRLQLHQLMREQFAERFGSPDTSEALSGFTPVFDTHVVLSLLAHTQAKRILEVGTAAGHMTANLTRWSPDDATVFTLGITDDMRDASRPEQHSEAPPRQALGQHSAHFGKGDKVFQITADSLRYDFQRLAPLDFAFLDGAHDRQHVLSDTRGVYAVLRVGGCLVWHDFGSTTPWVEVQQALEEAGLPEPIHYVEGTQVAFLFKQVVPQNDDGEPTLPQLSADTRPRVVWEGNLANVTSLALVNRQLCRRLLQRPVELSLLPREYHPVQEVPEVTLDPALTRCFRRRLPSVDVHVRHGWPVQLQAPEAGHWVLLQPWEFGSIPRVWAEVLAPQIDEVWVPSRYVRDCFVDGGFDPERVVVIPNGVDPDVFRADAPPFPLQTNKRFRFLFVGGTIHRKGIDVLLDAYGRAFTAADDVCLVIKDMGNGSFYRGQTAEQLLSAFRARPDAPAVEYLDATLTDAELAGLYTACDCLVHPYRGEGFGLPIAEAMCAARPVIVTGLGAALDFCSDQTAYLIPARRTDLPERWVGDLETVGTPWLAEPDVAALADLLRHVAAHPDEARAKGEAAAAHIRQHFTWDHAAALVEQRIQALRDRPVLRFQPRAVPAASSARPMRVSLCLIVKNEEDNLARCLGSVIDLVDEVSLLDTGSTDRTKEIAVSFGPKVKIHDFVWVDSFAAARNESIRHATGDYVFWLDGDDFLDEPNRQALRTLFAGLRDENAAWTMKCYCPPDRAGNSPAMVDHVRLFRRHPQHVWSYRVHEQILPALRRTGADVRRANVVIGHLGYLDPELHARKNQRNLRLLNLEVAEQPDSPFTLFNLGSSLQEIGRHEEAIVPLQRSLELSDPGDSIVRKLYAFLAGCHHALGRSAEAVNVCREGRRVCPGDTELLFREGQLLAELGSYPQAEACFRELLASQNDPQFASVDPNLRGWRGRHELARVLFHQRRYPEAWAEAVRVTQEAPDVLSGWLTLADAAQAAGQDEAVADVARRMAARPGLAVEAELVRGRWLLTKRQPEAARQLAERVLAEHPRELGAHLILGWAWQQSGNDREAERVWRAALLLDPCLGEAQRQLGDILRRRSRNEDAYFQAQGELTGWLLHEHYQAACQSPSPLQEHLPLLHELASGCRHITELGVGDGQAAWALLWAQPERLVCLDLVPTPVLARLQALAGQTQLIYRRADSLQVELEETDLLFVPQRSTEQLRQELARHGDKVKKYLVVQGTNNGAWPLVEEVLGQGGFRLKQRSEQHLGLAVLERA